MTSPQEPYPDAGKVELLTDVSEADVVDMVPLFRQLTDNSPDAEYLKTYIENITSGQYSQMFVIRDSSAKIVASATANICPIPTGDKAWIDDLVTDAAARGKGYAIKLMTAIHGWFLERGVESVNLTSNSSRLAAGSLYESLGYEERDTRVYRVTLK